MFQDWVTARNKTTNMKVSGQNSEGKKKLSGKKLTVAQARNLRQTQKGMEGRREELYYLTPIAPGIKIIE